MVARMAEQAPHDLKVVGSNPASGSYETVSSNLGEVMCACVLSSWRWRINERGTYSQTYNAGSPAVVGLEKPQEQFFFLVK